MFIGTPLLTFWRRSALKQVFLMQFFGKIKNYQQFNLYSNLNYPSNMPKTYYLRSSIELIYLTKSVLKATWMVLFSTINISETKLDKVYFIVLEI